MMKVLLVQWILSFFYLSTLWIFQLHLHRPRTIHWLSTRKYLSLSPSQSSGIYCSTHSCCMSSYTRFSWVSKLAALFLHQQQQTCKSLHGEESARTNPRRGVENQPSRRDSCCFVWQVLQTFLRCRGKMPPRRQKMSFKAQRIFVEKIFSRSLRLHHFHYIFLKVRINYCGINT